MTEVGKRYYFAAHAYHHFVGEVAEVLGRGDYVLRRCVRVQSCKRGWTEFFRDGFGEDTVYTHFPDGFRTEGGVIFSCPWKHPIPEAK